MYRRYTMTRTNIEGIKVCGHMYVHNSTPVIHNMYNGTKQGSGVRHESDVLHS